MTQKIIAKSLHLVSPECTAYTADLMERLEHTKAENPTEDALLDEVAAYAYCEQFALDTFARADNAVRANKVTACVRQTSLSHLGLMLGQADRRHVSRSLNLL
jgi:vacuolar protein sorting-associated protein VTA1